MRHFTNFVCDTCKQVRSMPGRCEFCEIPLRELRADEIEDFELNMDEALRVLQDRQWYI